jgi:hypothetical protein
MQTADFQFAAIAAGTIPKLQLWGHVILINHLPVDL